MPPKAPSLHHRSPGRGHIRYPNIPYDSYLCQWISKVPGIHSRSYISYRPSDRFISSMLLKPMAQEWLFPRFFCILVQGCSKSLLEFSIASHFINQTDSEAPQLLQSIESISNTFALSLCACKGSMSLACGTHAHASFCSDGGAIKTSQFT